MAMSDLPKDLLEEIFFKAPVESLGAIRCTCKKWNTLFNDQSFREKVFGKGIAAKEREFLVVLKMDYKVFLMSVNLNGIQEDDDINVKSSIMRKAKLISLYDDADYRVSNIFNVFHCDGLLLCITYGFRLVVWNPYCGQTRSIKPRNAYKICDWYALGYEKKKKNSLHSDKILRFDVNLTSKHEVYEFEIYHFNSDSWEVLYLRLDWVILVNQLGVSLKGNTYWLAREKHIEEQVRRQGIDYIDFPYFLICFDFTTERFGPRLPLPFHSCCPDTVILSSVREEQLAVLFQRKDTLLRMEVWVTNKIEPNEVSWNKLFLAVNMEQLFRFQFKPWAVSFFIDEEKNVAVVFCKDECSFKRNLAYIIGNDGYFKEVDLGEPADEHINHPIVFSYVPSSVKTKKPRRVMHQHHNVLVVKDRGIIGFGFGTMVNPIIQRYAPFLNTPVSAVQRCFR